MTTNLRQVMHIVKKLLIKILEGNFHKSFNFRKMLHVVTKSTMKQQNDVLEFGRNQVTFGDYYNSTVTK